MDRAKKQLFSDRIGVINNRLENFKEKKSQIERDLASQVPADIANHVTDHVTRKCDTEFRKSRWRQQQKLERLQQKSPHNVRRNTPDRVELGGEQYC